MDKNKTLAELYEKNPNSEVWKTMDATKADMLVLIYYINKLKEAELIKGGPNVTGKGFDVVMDILDSGWKITLEEAEQMCIGGELGSSIQESKIIAAIVIELQTNGYQSIIDKVKKLKQFVEDDGN